MKIALRIKRKKGGGGFALIISMALMGFVFLLLVSLSTMLRVETESSVHNRQLNIARMNAMFGFRVALGQLQKFMGPDRRVSASADIEQGATGGISPNAGGRYWTGVWGNGAGPDELSSSPVFMTWLVSGNEGVHASVSDDGTVTASGTVTFSPEMGGMPAVTATTAVSDELESGGHRWSLLVGSNTVGGQAGDEHKYVVAPIVDISDDGGMRTGGYAYWIGDEGIKARVNLVESDEVLYPAEEDQQKMDNLRYRRPARSAVEAVKADWLSGFSSITDPDSSEGGQLRSELERLIALAQVGMIGPVDADFGREHFHDISLSSQGVLADTLHGGLKKDLTAAFAPGTDKDSAPSGLIWERYKSDVTGGLGPLWETLRSWYQFADETGNSLEMRKIDWNGRHQLTPVVAHWQWYVQAGIYLVNSATYEYRFGFRMYPALVLWNPYDVTLRGETLRISYANGTIEDPNRMAFMLRAWKAGSSGDVPAAFEANAGFIAPWTSENDSSGDPVPLRFTVSTGDMEPGRAYVYTLGSDVTYTDSSASDSYLLVRGWNFDGGNPTALVALSPVTFTLPAGEEPSDYRVSYWVSGGDEGADLNNLDWNKPINGVNNSEDWGLIGREALELDLHDPANPTTSLRMQGIEEINGFFRTYLSPELWQNGLVPSLATVPGVASGFQDLGFYGQRWSLKASETDPLYQSGSASEQEYNNSIRWLANFNPRAVFSTRSPFENQNTAGNSYFNTNPSYNRITQQSDRAGNFFNPASASFLINYDPGTDAAYVGMSQIPRGATPSPVILFSVPRPDSRILSLGALQHAHPFRPSGPTGSAKAAWATNTAPAYAIGNSLANPRGALDEYRVLARDITSKSGIYGSSDYLLDYSYLLNRALWDGYFFSSVPFAPDPVTFPLDNSRYSLLGELSESALRDYDRGAAHLMIEGSFNVNSTSEAAWRALLASFNNIPVNGEAMPDRSPYPRADVPTEGAFDPDSGGDASTQAGAYNGSFRYLTEDQINVLAAEIVSEVRLRGPFVSLADFVNRSLSGGEEVQLRGALAAALDRTDINAGFDGETALLRGDASMDGAIDIVPEANEGQTATHAPGWVSQADLLQAIGPVLAARSDTFTIRSYGDVTDPVSGVVQAQAWCDVVVQRCPEYINGGDAWEVPDAANQAYGRRFKIVSLTWLSANDI